MSHNRVNRAPEKFPLERNVFILTSSPERAVTGECARRSAQTSCRWDGKSEKEIAQAYEDQKKAAGEKRP